MNVQTCCQIHKYKTSLHPLVKLVLADRGGRVNKGFLESPHEISNTEYIRPVEWLTTTPTNQLGIVIAKTLKHTQTNTSKNTETDKKPNTATKL